MPADSQSVSDELLERIAVDETYARLNHLWKIHGLAAVTAFYSSPRPRRDITR